MLSKENILTETVRLLEQNQHAFSSDPLLITEKIKQQIIENNSQDSLSDTECLQRRARRIDSDHVVRDKIHQLFSRFKFATISLTLIWAVLGFATAFGLMQSSILNFFFILIALLGLNTLTLIGWLAVISRPKQDFGWLINPRRLLIQRDAVSRQLSVLLTDLLKQAEMQRYLRWFSSTLSHQLWLATLIGSLLACIVLLAVRQYHFLWQTTILSTDIFVHLVSMLAWLPNQLGIAVPDAALINQSQLINNNQLDKLIDTHASKRWANLLIFCLVIYGILPRAIAWVISRLQVSRIEIALPLELPYYRKLIKFWRRQVIDVNDMPEETVTPIAKAKPFSSEQVYLLALDYPTDFAWLDSLVNKLNIYHQADSSDRTAPYTMDSITNLGVIEDRESLNKTTSTIASKPAPLIIAIKDTALADRGTLRQLDKLSSATNQPTLVWQYGGNSIKKTQTNQSLSDPQRQWLAALQERQIYLLNQA